MHTRQMHLEALKKPWDVVVVGGGINGAGVFGLAAAHGLRVLLLEQRDFAWGTSSRSGKMVHGGLRYLLQGQPRTTWHSVRQRELLRRRFDGLVDDLGFLFPLERRRRLAKPMVHLVLGGYGMMAGRLDHRFHGDQDFSLLAPGVATGRLCGGFSFGDAATDDARLVWRVLQQGLALGGKALNYVRVADLLRGPDGRVRGVVARDAVGGGEYEVAARVVINASGAWTDEVRAGLGRPRRLRRLRGSHLVLPQWRLPLAQAVGLRHPDDGRAMYVMPWDGVSLVGTTDIDHRGDMSADPRISAEEGAYLLRALEHWFPSRGIGREDVISTFAGVRPVIDTGKVDPSKEARDHAVWDEDGLITMTGGKLTTFAMVAAQALEAAARPLGLSKRVDPAGPMSKPVLAPPEPGMADGPAMRRLRGRFGYFAPQVAADGDNGRVGRTAYLWSELKWAACCERSVRLEDIMLRRTRLGLLLPGGGADLLESVGARVRTAMGWDQRQWAAQRDAYLDLWQRAYSPGLLSC